MFEGRAAIGYDHGNATQKFYLGLALDPAYVEGFVEGCLQRMGEDRPEDEALFKGLLWDGERGAVMAALRAQREVLAGTPEGY